MKKEFSNTKEVIIGQEKNDQTSYNLLDGNYLKSSSESRIARGISCTLNQFITFVGAKTDKAKIKVVRGQKEPSEPGKTYFWYRSAFAAIAKSLLQNSSVPWYEKLSELSDKKPDPNKRNDKFNIQGSIDALKAFGQMSLPEPFNHLTKIKVDVDSKVLIHNGISLKITPDVIFRATYQGKTVIGAVKLLIRKKPKLSEEQRKGAAYLLREYLIENVKGENEEVLGDLCLYIDVFAQRATKAPDKYSAPINVLGSAGDEYADIWNKLIIQEN